jgi:hypothetical protein
MKGLLDLLAKARLVELSESERAQATPPEQVPPLPAEQPPEMELPQATLPAVECGIEEGRPLEDIFTLAGVAPAPFPAEKLLRLLDGLRAMDAATRKTAVLAMDAADDNWQIADPILDAQRKIAALDAYKQRVGEQVTGAEKHTGAQITEINSTLDRTTAEIRTQISELEALLEREVTKAAQQTTNLEAGLRAAREAAARELRRMDAEIARFAEIPVSFTQPPDNR